MKLRRALHLVGAGALTGALLLGTAPPASADDIRDRQWALDAFAAEDIWQHSTGKGVTVAVIDTGVDSTHPDLQGHVLEGKSFAPGGGSALKDVSGHGTAMASVIAGQGHGPGDESGVMGLAPDAAILPVKTHERGSQLGISAHEAIRYAVEQGADVISISRGTTKDAREQRAIKHAIESGVVVVASTGNEGKKVKQFPAAYPGVVAVGGVDTTGSVWEGASWGSNTTLIAPAEDNVVADPTAASGYSLTDGTSAATAYVAAAAALVIAEHPDLTAGQVIHRLVETAKVPQGEEVKGQLPDEKFGYGIVRPLRAVTFDIAPGPEEGPLAQPSGEHTSTVSGSDDSQAAPGDDSPAAESRGLGGVLIGVVVVVALGVLGFAVFLVLKGRRKTQPTYAATPSGGSGVLPQQWGQQAPPQSDQCYGPPASPPVPPNQPPSPS